MIPYGCQTIDEEDIAAVREVLLSDFLTQGPLVREFEKKVAQHVGANAAVMTNSATSSLHIACLALGVSEGDIVWTTPISFVASANCALYCRATVDFVDIDERTGNISVNALEEKLLQAKQNNCLPKVVIPVHFAGAPCEMDKIADLAKEFDFKVIEDASHALGASYKGKLVGSSVYSDITVFSFHPVKMITTGEGGCLCTNDKHLEITIRKLVSHGITKDPADMHRADPEPWWYEQQMLGFNYRMTEIQAALGISQLKKLNGWVAKRNQLIQEYQSKTEGLPVDWLNVPDDSLCSYHLAVIKVDGESRKALFDFLRSHNIGCQVHYIPIYQQPFYHHMGNHWPHAEKFYRQVISLPLYPRLTGDQQDYVVQILWEFFQ